MRRIQGGCLVLGLAAVAGAGDGDGERDGAGDGGGVLARFAAEAERAGEQEKKVDSGALRDILGGGSD